MRLWEGCWLGIGFVFTSLISDHDQDCTLHPAGTFRVPSALFELVKILAALEMFCAPSYLGESAGLLPQS